MRARIAALVITTAALLGAAPHGAAAQPSSVAPATAAAWITEADRRYDARDPAGVIAACDSALAREPAAAGALWRAARSAVDLGEFEPVERVAHGHFARARGYAERAVAADTSSGEARFQLARAIGRAALASSPRERVRLSTAVREHALGALARAPAHPGALHILGVWNAEVMRLNVFERTMAKTFLGGKVLGEANWAAAAQHLERAVEVEPERIVHRLDLGRVYRDTRRADQARAQFEWIAGAPVTDYNDVHYKRAAADELRRLR